MVLFEVADSNRLGRCDSFARMIIRRLFMVFVATLAAWPAVAQTYPQRPIRLIVPFPPGAGTDVVARLVSGKLADELGQPIVVENRTGAGGAIGAEAVAKADSDGYTLLFVASPFTTVAAAAAKPTYDPVKQFAAASLIATGPLVFVVTPSLPVTSMRELVALARAQPGVLNYGSAGTGGVNHLVLEMLRLKAGIDIVHIPYRGIGPAVVDLLGGAVQTLTATVPAVVPHLKQGKVRALAVTGARRVPQLPDVPTMREAGLDGLEVYNYWGFVAPAGTPRAVLDRLHAGVERALADPKLRGRLGEEGVEIVLAGPTAFARFLADDLAAWRRVVTQAGVVVD